MQTMYLSIKDYNSETLRAIWTKTHIIFCHKKQWNLSLNSTRNMIVMYTFLLYLCCLEAGTDHVIGQSYIQLSIRIKISRVNFLLKHIKSAEPAKI